MMVLALLSPQNFSSVILLALHTVVIFVAICVEVILIFVVSKFLFQFFACCDKCIFRFLLLYLLQISF